MHGISVRWLAVGIALAVASAGCIDRAAPPGAAGSSEQTEVAPPDSPQAAGEAQVSAAGADQVAAGHETSEILQRLERLEATQQRTLEMVAQRQGAGVEGLPPPAEWQLDDHWRERIEEAQYELAGAREGIAGLPQEENLAEVLDLLNFALDELVEEAWPCPEPERRVRERAAARQQLQRAAAWIEQQPDNPSGEWLRTMLAEARRDLDAGRCGDQPAASEAPGSTTEK